MQIFFFPHQNAHGALMLIELRIRSSSYRLFFFIIIFFNIFYLFVLVAAYELLVVACGI